MNYLGCSALGALVMLGAVGCSDTGNPRVSPTKVVQAVWKVGAAGKASEVRRLLFVAPGEDEATINQRVTTLLQSSSERGIATALFVSRQVEYEHVAQDGTAEVGVVLKAGPTRKRIPFQQIILRQQEGTWKYDRSTYDLTPDELEARMRCDPEDASAYYLMGRKLQPTNPVKAESYFRKYWELDPGGFWVDDDFKNRMREAGQGVEQRVEKLLSDARPMPPTSPNRARIYCNIARMYMAERNHEKASEYLALSRSILQADPDPRAKALLADVETELKESIQAAQRPSAPMNDSSGDDKADTAPPR